MTKPTLLDEFSHLWDGSQPGWVLHRFDETIWTVTFHFGEDGPTKRDVVQLRELLDHFRDEPLSMVWATLKGSPSYRLDEPMGNIEHRQLVDTARSRGLRTSSVSTTNTSYLPIFADASALIIEDEATCLAVAKQMIDAGVQVVETHSD